MSVITVAAPAKLNLFLHMTGKREDGYHLLESLVAFTDFGDTLHIEPAEQLSLHVQGEFAHLLDGPAEDNLVFKAAQLLRSQHAMALGARITLTKSLPVGSGFGGGSADAAAVLAGLAELWGVKLDAAFALTLGSDVPMCMESRPAMVRGVGEIIEPLSLPAGVHVLLAHPRAPLLTADVYRQFKGPFSPPVAQAGWDSARALVAYLGEQHNDLQPPAMAIMPAVGDIVNTIAATDGCLLARMSGSGAGCFGLYASAEDALEAHNHFQSTHPQWWSAATQLKEHA